MRAGDRKQGIYKAWPNILSVCIYIQYSTVIYKLMHMGCTSMLSQLNYFLLGPGVPLKIKLTKIIMQSVDTRSDRSVQTSAGWSQHELNRHGAINWPRMHKVLFASIPLHAGCMTTSTNQYACGLGTRLHVHVHVHIDAGAQMESETSDSRPRHRQFQYKLDSAIQLLNIRLVAASLGTRAGTQTRSRRGTQRECCSQRQAQYAGIALGIIGGFVMSAYKQD